MVTYAVNTSSFVAWPSNTLSNVKLCDSMNFVKSTFYLYFNTFNSICLCLLELFDRNALFIMHLNNVDFVFLLLFGSEGPFADDDPDLWR